MGTRSFSLVLGACRYCGSAAASVGRDGLWWRRGRAFGLLIRAGSPRAGSEWTGGFLARCVCECSGVVWCGVVWWEGR